MMIRYFSSVFFLLSCTALTVQAKGMMPVVVAPASSACPAATKATSPMVAEIEVVTSDMSRATRQINATFSYHPSDHSDSNPNTLASPASDDSHPAGLCERLARVTAYWACEGDYYTRHRISATGVRLHEGLCAVDPTIIPYGSIVAIAGLGQFLAVDTGSAVIDRTAAREAGHTSAERHALVVDLFFESRVEGERFEAEAAKFTNISWWRPAASSAARGLFADEDWTKIQSKQL